MTRESIRPPVLAVLFFRKVLQASGGSLVQPSYLMIDPSTF